MCVARLRGVTKSYRLRHGDVHALRGVDLELAEGELCALVGASGSGKTTLLNVLGCLDVPTAGSYELDGRRVDGADADALAWVRSQQIGFVFQGFNLIPVLTAAENVELSLVCQGAWTAAERRSRVEELLEAVGLSAHAGHRPDELSGGQKQRVAIARALAPRPRLVLADEPTASLDSATAEEVMGLLKALNRREQVTIVLSTHDTRVLRHVSRVLEMRDGVLGRPAAAPARRRHTPWVVRSGAR